MGNDNKRIDYQSQWEVLRLPILPINSVDPRNDDNVRTIHAIHE